MKNAISIKNVSVSYSHVEAINDITFDINEGEFICIIGPNGGGKTTLLNTILNFIKPDKGSVEIFGKSVKNASRDITYVPQISNVEQRFPISVKETVMTAFLNNGLHPFRFFKREESKKAEELLKLVGLEDKGERQVSALSGGEFQRMLIARSLAARRKIILLDEPTANVDPSTRNKIFEILADLNKKGITVVIVTHDLAAAKKYATKLVCVKKDLVYCGEPQITKEITEALYGENSYITGGFSDD